MYSENKNETILEGIFVQVLLSRGRRGGLMVSALNSGSSDRGSSLGRGTVKANAGESERQSHRNMDVTSGEAGRGRNRATRS